MPVELDPTKCPVRLCIDGRYDVLKSELAQENKIGNMTFNTTKLHSYQRVPNEEILSHYKITYKVQDKNQEKHYVGTESELDLFLINLSYNQ